MFYRDISLKEGGPLGRVLFILFFLFFLVLIFLLVMIILFLNLIILALIFKLNFTIATDDVSQPSTSADPKLLAHHVTPRNWAPDERPPSKRFNCRLFFPGALYREFRELMRILMTFLGKTSWNPS